MKKLFSVMFGLLLGSGHVNAVDVGVGAKAGLLGAGVDVSVAITDTVNARLTATSYDVGSESETVEVGDTGNSADLDADADFDLGATGVLFDWYVFDGTFHLTAGLMQNNSEISISSNLTGDIEVDGEPLSTSDINGGIDGKLKFGDSVQPYLGVGWGRKASREAGLAFTAEIGVLFLDPKVDLDATVDTSGSNSLDQDELNDRLEGVEDDAKDDLADFDIWPVLSFGINYAF